MTEAYIEDIKLALSRLRLIILVSLEHSVFQEDLIHPSFPGGLQSRTSSAVFHWLHVSNLRKDAVTGAYISK